MQSLLSTAVRMLRSERIRGAICLLLLPALLVSPLPVWLALLAPIAVYVGLSLVVMRDRPHRTIGQINRNPMEAKQSDRLAACMTLHRILLEHQRALDGDPVEPQLARINQRSSQVLSVIIEDGKQHAADDVFGLLETIDSLLSAYRKLARRSLAGPEASIQLRSSLETMEAALERLWERLNRDVVVSLATLHDVIELQLSRPDSAISNRHPAWMIE